MDTQDRKRNTDSVTVGTYVIVPEAEIEVEGRLDLGDDVLQESFVAELLEMLELRDPVVVAARLDPFGLVGPSLVPYGLGRIRILDNARSAPNYN